MTPPTPTTDSAAHTTVRRALRRRGGAAAGSSPFEGVGAHRTVGDVDRLLLTVSLGSAGRVGPGPAGAAAAVAGRRAGRCERWPGETGRPVPDGCTPAGHHGQAGRCPP